MPLPKALDEVAQLEKTTVVLIHSLGVESEEDHWWALVPPPTPPNQSETNKFRAHDATEFLY